MIFTFLVKMIKKWSLRFKLKVMLIDVILIYFILPLLNLHCLYIVSKCEL